MFRSPLRLSLALVLAACGDSTSSGGASDSGTGSSSTGGSTGVAGSTGGPVPTTSLPELTTDDSAGMSAGTSLPTSTSPDLTTSDVTTADVTTADATTTDATTADATTDTTGDPVDTTAADECRQPADCPEVGPCRAPTCDAGTCGAMDLSAGTDCPGGVCDGAGACVACLADADCPPAGDCVAVACQDAACVADDLPLGTDCPAGACDGAGACVECNLPADCASGLCQDHVCVAASCLDALKNGAETDIDCGGPDCAPCPPGDTCAGGSDCTSGVCTDQVCQAPKCSDGVHNGAETDLDCGGDCPPCTAGEGCEDPTDCESGVCSANTCAAPSCSDGVHNGDETDLDCGGACPGCPDGHTCSVDGDCESGACEAGACVPPAADCATAPPDPATGQRCPLFMPCAQSSECGVFQGCQQWFCNNASTCELNALVGCGATKGGGCDAGVVFVQHTAPPVDKRFLPPDGVAFREVATLAFTVHNNTASDLYLDKIPVALETAGGASKFDVSSAKVFDNSGGTEHGPGDLLVCLTADPFSFPANGVLGPCGGSAFARVPKGASNQFLVTLAFAKEKTYIAGRGYRLKLASAAGVAFRVGANGPAYEGTRCGVPAEGYTGAWVTADEP